MQRILDRVFYLRINIIKKLNLILSNSIRINVKKLTINIIYFTALISFIFSKREYVYKIDI